MTTGTWLKALLGVALGTPLVSALAFFPFSSPKVFGDFILGKTTEPEASEILEAKPGCRFRDEVGDSFANTNIEVTFHNYISIKRPQTCGYNFPGQTTITMRSDHRDDNRINVISLEIRDLPNCQEVYMPLLEKTWKKPTESLVTGYGRAAYWLKKDIVVLFEVISQGPCWCNLMYYTPRVFREETDIGKMVEAKESATKPITPL